MNGNNATYFDSFYVEYIPKEFKTFIEKNIARNIDKIQAFESIMCEYWSIEFVDFMLKGKSLLNYTNFFFPIKYKKNGKIILKHFQ